MNPQAMKLSTLSQKQVSQIYRNVFGSIDGQLVLEDLRFRCNVYIPSFDESQSNEPWRTIFNEGKRSVLLTIETQMRPDIEKEQ